MYDDDTPEKLEKLLGQLDRIDYIFLSSNRLFLSIPRLPMRYPMTTAYYRLLFNGELGFDLAAKITSFPNLGPVEFNDEGSDEAFTVYDHPQVHIFRKTERFSRERARELLGKVDWHSIQRLRPIEASRAKGGLMLSPSDRDVYARSGTWSAMFHPSDLANRLPVMAWLLCVELIGLAAFPLAYWLLPSLSDRGYLLCKSLGILLLAWISWLAASIRICSYGRTEIIVSLLGLLLLGIVLAWRQWQEMRSFVRERWPLLLLGEALFLAAFMFLLLIRMGNPDLWHPVTGGEKPMDFAYLNAVIKSPHFPPYDPWYAGGYINYYYFGQVITATLIKLTGIVPWVAYNLAVPLFYALTALGAFSAVYHLVLPMGRDWLSQRAARYGLLSVVFLGVIGNLGQVRLLQRALRKLSPVDFTSTIPGLGMLVNSLAGLYRCIFEAQSLPVRTEWWYWNATRAIASAPDEVGPISEFPFFTFLYGDLHAHLIALPFALLVVALAVGWMRQWIGESTRPTWHVTPTGLIRAAFMGLCVGVLWATNTWDYPTYTLVMLAALVIGLYAAASRLDRVLVSAFGWRAVVLIGVSLGAFWPFHSHYVLGYTSLGRWKGSLTGLGDYLIIHGFFLFVVITFLVVELLRRGAMDGPVHLLLILVRWGRLPRVARLHKALVREASIWYRLALWGLVAILGLAIVLGLFGLGVFAVSVPLVGLGTLFLCWPAQQSAPRRFLLLIILLAWALTLAVEVVVLKGDIGRMNTVFKFYLQAWVLWALATAVALAWVAPPLQRWAVGWPWWQAACGALLIGCLIYTPLAAGAKISDRFDRAIGPTLDGMAYMRSATYQEGETTLKLEQDRQAMLWMLENIRGSPVVLEANVLLYRWGNRVSIYTGLPTIVGWDWHQRQQRGHIAGEGVTRRVGEVREIYSTGDLTRAQELLHRFQVKYIYLGELERAVYPSDGLVKFERWAEEGFLREVYRNAGVVIYEVLW